MNKIEQLEQFLQSAPGDAFLTHALALEYIKLGNDGKALDIFIALLKEQPTYVGSYYHLAKLLERMGDKGQAVNWYRKGMEQAKLSGDRHAHSELQMAYEEIMEED